jgi:hypothetical protein
MGRSALAFDKAHPQASTRSSARGTEIGGLELREHRHPEQGEVGCPSRGALLKKSLGNFSAETSRSTESAVDCADRVSLVT